MVGAGRDLRPLHRLRPSSFIRASSTPPSWASPSYPNESLGFTSSEAAAGARSPGIAVPTRPTALASVRKAAASGAFVVLLAHGGTEYVEKPSASTRRLYARFAEAGADLVIGTHPSPPPGLRGPFAGSLIAYSLGNFLYSLPSANPRPRGRRPSWSSSIYEGKVRGLRLFPVLAGYDGSVEDPDRGGRENRFSMLCAGLESGSSVK